MKQTTLEEKSAGGVVFRKLGENGDVKFLLGKHSGYHKWVLPKGLVERGESDIEAALREVEEEVGVQAQVVSITPVKTIEYFYYADFGKKMGMAATGQTSERRVKKYQEDGAGKTRVHKKVIFYLMEFESDLGKEGWEMEERKWVGYEEGKSLLAFETEQEVFIEAWKTLRAPAET